MKKRFLSIAISIVLVIQMVIPAMGVSAAETTVENLPTRVITSAPCYSNGGASILPIDGLFNPDVSVEVFDKYYSWDWVSGGGQKETRFPIYVLVEYDSPITFNAYTFRTGGDEPGRDPKEWEVFGVNSETPIDTSKLVASGDPIQIPEDKFTSLIADNDFESLDVVTDGDQQIPGDQTMTGELDDDITRRNDTTFSLDEETTCNYIIFRFDDVKDLNAPTWGGLQLSRILFESGEIPIKVNSLTIAPKTLSFEAPGGTQKLTVAVGPEDAANKNVNWTSNKETVATVAADGTVTAVAGGTATITATAQGGAVKDTCTVTVRELVTGITVSPKILSLEEGAKNKLSAAAVPTTATDKTVKWTSDNTEVATVATDGTVTAVKVGTATITATANDGSGKTDTCEVTVTPKEIPKVLVESVTINPKTLSLDLEKTQKLGVTVAPADATDNSVKWTSSNPIVATVSTDGTVTAKTVGEAIITAEAQDESGKSDTCTVTVNLAAINSYKITYVLNGGANNQSNPTTYNKGVTVSFKNLTRAGYQFGGWYADFGFKTKVTSVKDKDITVYAKWVKVSVAKASIKNLKNKKAKQASLTIKKVSGANGYNVLYAQNSKFTKNKNSLLLTKVSGEIKKLKKGKTYYFKVQAYKLDSTGKKVYGAYGKAKKLKIKK